MTTAAWFHCFAGIAGDMALGALIDAGADVAEVRAMLDRLPMAGWSMEVSPVMRGGIGATKVDVVVAETAVVRTYAHITGLIDEARLPERVANRAQATFAALADAEGHLHRRPVAQVHFHEVGGVDAVIDVVGTCAALEVLGSTRCGRAPWPTAWAWSAPPTACCRCRRRRWSSCYGAPPATGATSPTSSPLPPVPPSWPPP
jgi:pyridinium-3,5-bisthiocarboxylic acid mononucleotide nickel chelatase